MYDKMHNPLIFCISYDAKCKEYHYQKLALESRKVCRTFVYLATLLHSNNTKDVKELMAQIRKNVAKVLAVRTSSGDCFHF